MKQKTNNQVEALIMNKVFCQLKIEGSLGDEVT